MEITPPPFGHFLFHKWQLKLLSVVGALIIWLCVSQTITASKTLVNVPVRLVNVPAERSAEGMLPNGVLKKRVAVTLTGAKDVIDPLENSDLEVVIDVSQSPEQSIVQVSKKNLMSLDPRLDLARYITQVESSDVIVQLSKLVAQVVPVAIAPPIGSPPEGYEFLDIWPQNLYQSVTGSEKEVQELKERGLKFVIDLNRITKAELDVLHGSSEAFRGDEVVFPIPGEWKRVIIPCRESEEVMMNDPLQKELVIRFLRKELVPLGVGVLVQVYYPVLSKQQVNPERTPLVADDAFLRVNGMTIVPEPLFAAGVSRWFIEVVRDRMSLIIVADSSKKDEPLSWGVEIAGLAQLEDAFVLFLMNDHEKAPKERIGDLKKRETRLRRRFRSYVCNMRLYRGSDAPLQLVAKFSGDAKDGKEGNVKEGKGKILLRDLSKP